MTCFFIIAHAPLASALRAAALHVFPDEASAIVAYDVQPNEVPQQAVLAAQIKIKHLLNQAPAGTAAVAPSTTTTALASTLPPMATIAQTRAPATTITTRPMTVLILSDLFGATPCNIAAQLVDGVQSKLVAGVNLPMLLRAISYRHEPLDSVLSRAVTGGIQGVMAVAVTPQQHQRMKTYDQNHYHHQQ